MFRQLSLVAAVLLLASGAAFAEMSQQQKAPDQTPQGKTPLEKTPSEQMSREHMSHGQKPKETCSELSLRCAASVTPTFARDGTLWIAARVNNQIYVATSKDRGETFTPPVVVSPDSLTLDWGPDARPKIASDRNGRVIVAFASFRDQKYNGEVFYTRSTDGGRSFAPAAPITSDPASQRFVSFAIDPNGAIFAAWLDKRGRAQALEKGEAYAGAALAYAWSGDHGATFTEARIAQDHTCECCRIDVAFAGSGRPVVLFRNLFDLSVRDHAVLVFKDRTTPGEIHRVSNDDWAIDACPHHGPSLAVGPDGAIHAAWFTAGRNRKGLFYARSTDGGKSFGEPMPVGRPDRAPSRPQLLAAGGKVWLAWKEFDGEQTNVMVMVSHDNGAHWSAPRAIASTSDESDHPILVKDGRRAFLSWQTQKEGYHLLELDDAS